MCPLRKLQIVLYFFTVICVSCNTISDNPSIEIPEKSDLAVDSSVPLKITGEWDLLSGWFPNDNIEFGKSLISSHSEKFNFIDGGKILITYKNSGDCPVGEFALHEGCWALEGNFLTLELRGTYFLSNGLWWKIKYEVAERSDKYMLLKKVSVLENVETLSPDTWKELSCS